MKKYNMEGNVTGVIFMVIWSFALLGFVVAMIVMSDGEIPLFGFIVPGFMFLFGFIGLVNQISGLARKNYALKGTKSVGVITNYQERYSQNNTYIRVEISYKGTDSNQYIAICNLPIKYRSSVSEGMKVPIYVNGKYAYYDIDALDRGDFNESDTTDDNNGFGESIICDCGYIVKPGLIYCPKCGRAVEDMHKNNPHDNHDEHNNYCPSCGALVEDDQKFCKYCGYRLKN